VSVASAGAAKPANVRFLIVYVALGLVLVGSFAALIVFGLRPGFSSSPKWSSWKPHSGRLPIMAREIAEHVAPEYKFANGGQLVAVVASAPAVTAGTQNIGIVAVSTRLPNGKQHVQQLTPGATEMYTLCGLGSHCAIAAGKPSLSRGRLVRREGLELALYTFKYVPAVDSVLVYLPPVQVASSALTAAPATTLLYFTKESLSGRLDLPLSSTLLRKNPPPAGTDAPEETALIDGLTVPHLFSAGLVQLQAGGALLVLNPAG